MNCENCGAPITENTEFCKFCGAKLPKPEQPVVNNTYNKYETHNIMNNTTNINNYYGKGEIPRHKKSVFSLIIIAVGLVFSIVGIVLWANGDYNFIVLGVGLALAVYGLLEINKTAVCSGCRKIIYKSAKLCPHCNTVRKNRRFIKISVSIIFSVLVMIIARFLIHVG